MGVKPKGRKVPHQRSVYPAVCLEWQEFFEAATFSKLVLRKSDLPAFGQLIKRRQGSMARPGPSESEEEEQHDDDDEMPVPVIRRHMPHIQHIWLHMRSTKWALEYPSECPWCNNHHGDEELDTAQQTCQNWTFTWVLYELLRILRMWEKGGISSAQSGNLALEISIGSPNGETRGWMDSRLLGREFPEYSHVGHSAQTKLVAKYCDSDKVNSTTEGPIFRSLSKVMAKSPFNLHLESKVSERGQVRARAPVEFQRRMCWFRSGVARYETHAWEDFWFPRVQMVTSLLVRRQTHWDISPRALGRLVRESLVGLRDFRLERCRLDSNLFQKRYDEKLGPTDLISCSGAAPFSFSPSAYHWLGELPKTLESLHLFEDDLHIMYHRSRPRSWKIYVLKGLATTLPHIRHLSVSFQSDAMECLKLPSKDTAFPNLETIALTSKYYLQPDQPERLNRLLLRAARAARNMPALQVMEIWNCENGYAAYFRYEASPKGASMGESRFIWRCSWHKESKDGSSDIKDSVLEAWREVAGINQGRALIFDRMDQSLPTDKYTHWVEILNHLALKRSIIHPITEIETRVELKDLAKRLLPAW